MMDENECGGKWMGRSYDYNNCHNDDDREDGEAGNSERKDSSYFQTGESSGNGCWYGR